MDLNTIFATFVNWQTLLLCLGICVITFVIRTIVETFWVDAKTNRFWRELFLPLGAICNGALIGAFAHMFPWPIAGISESLIAKLFYGAVCGMASGTVYSRFKSWLKSGNTSSSDQSPVEEPPNQS